MNKNNKIIISAIIIIFIITVALVILTPFNNLDLASVENFTSLPSAIISPNKKRLN